MPPPFPGIDPFIEGQIWEDFHHGFIEMIREALMPQIRPRYVARVEERVYVEHETGDRSDPIRPDLALLAHDNQQPAQRGAAGAATAVPVVLNLPLPIRQREAFLTLRARSNMEIVTIIELLSPGNKRPGSQGRREYLSKREGVLQSAVHLVELDLLRGGERLPTIEPLPIADYYAFVCYADNRPRALVYPWTVREPMPVIPVPLRTDEPDASLDLQEAFTTLYNRAGYDYSLDYHLPATPPMSDEDVDWVRGVLESSE